MNFPVVDLSEPSPVTVRLAVLQAAALVHQRVPSEMGRSIQRSSDSEVLITAEVFARWVQEGR